MPEIRLDQAPTALKPMRDRGCIDLVYSSGCQRKIRWTELRNGSSSVARLDFLDASDDGRRIGRFVLSQ